MALVMCSTAQYVNVEGGEVVDLEDQFSTAERNLTRRCARGSETLPWSS